MNPSLLVQLPTLLDSLSDVGWAQMPLAIARQDCLDLAQHLEKRYSSGDFHQAQVGNTIDHSEQQTIRGDKIDWIGSEDPDRAVQSWLTQMIELTSVLNENFFLSLNSFDCHFACYEPGSFYKKHLDRFQEDSGRKISVVLFLNDKWLKEEEGELLIYDSVDKDLVIAEITPEIGTLVLFQSQTILHEVRTTKRRRLSLSGWLKADASLGVEKGHFA